jgi:pRiA4b ORF-3-like protein
MRRMVIQMTANSSRQVFQFHLSLDGATPPIWRRILVPADFTLAQLHRVIQAVMDWTDDHLHEFKVAGRLYGIPDPDGEHESIDDRTVRLRDLNLTPRTRISYTYDLGDEWVHALKVEEVSQGDSDDIRALCVAGERSGPPEDVGGVFGYEELLVARSDPNHEQHNDAKDWLGDFDPEYFSIEEANQRIRKSVRRSKTAKRT